MELLIKINNQNYLTSLGVDVALQLKEELKEFSLSQILDLIRLGANKKEIRIQYYKFMDNINAQINDRGCF